MEAPIADRCMLTRDRAGPAHGQTSRYRTFRASLAPITFPAAHLAWSSGPKICASCHVLLPRLGEGPAGDGRPPVLPEGKPTGREHEALLFYCTPNLAL